MASSFLLVDAVAHVATASVYAFVGSVVWKRHIGGDGKLAAMLFGAWWFGLAAITASGAVQRALFWAGVEDLSVFITLSQLNLLVLCVALWGLLYYFVYLFTGERRWLARLAVAYFAYYVSLLYYMAWREPNGVEVGDWSVALAFARDIPAPAAAALVLLLVGPAILGSLAYARLFFRVRDPTVRYRIGMVSLAIFGWFATLLGGWTIGMPEEPWWPFITRAIALLAALVVLAAFRPPAWVRARWSVRPAEEDPAAAVQRARTRM